MPNGDMMESPKRRHLRRCNPEPDVRTRVLAVELEVLANNVIPFDDPLSPEERLVCRTGASDENRVLRSPFSADNDARCNIRAMNFDNTPRRKPFWNRPPGMSG